MILEMLKNAERVDFRFGGVRSGSFCHHVSFRPSVRPQLRLIHWNPLLFNLIGLAIFLALKMVTPIEYITNHYSVFNAFQQFRTLSILVGVT
jgi:hypothetical protein